MAKASKGLRPGTVLLFGEGGGRRAHVVSGREENAPGDHTIGVDFDAPVLDWIYEVGEVPLPPYIHRPNGTSQGDQERYQTVYAKHEGAVAAPTAGLHLTEALMGELHKKGCELAYITLHVGLGTFAPVREDELDNHHMHEERFEIPQDTALLIAAGRPIVAVGTTVVRALESQSHAGVGATSIFIRPGFSFQVVDYLLTNFHLPESTLLMMVSAFAGYQRIKEAYGHAVEQKYRFFSYGDAMFLRRL